MVGEKRWENAAKNETFADKNRPKVTPLLLLAAESAVVCEKLTHNF